MNAPEESAVSMNAWAAERQAEGDLTGAILGFSGAVMAGRKEFGDDSPTVAILLNNLANVQSQVGNHQEALDEYQMAERIDRAAYGPLHPKVGDRVYRVGIAYGNLGNREGERACYEEALLILLRTRGVQGEDTMDVALCLLGCGGDPIGLARAKGIAAPIVEELHAEFRRRAEAQKPARTGGLRRLFPPQR